MMDGDASNDTEWCLQLGSTILQQVVNDIFLLLDQQVHTIHVTSYQSELFKPRKWTYSRCSYVSLSDEPIGDCVLLAYVFLSNGSDTVNNRILYIAVIAHH